MTLALSKAGKLSLCFPALPSAMVMALGKDLFAECGTRQRGGNAIFLFFAFHQHKQRNYIYINT
jgi:hypothetical protein